METETLINAIASALKQVAGVSAVVLGGSRARGTQTATSDVDLGIYYHPDRPLDLVALNRVAAQFDDERRPQLLTPIGGWGPWINGGGWLTVRSVAVDFLYRDLSKVAAVIAACHQGQVEMVYQPGHPHGFVSSIYMGEVAVCRPVWEADRGELSALKARTTPYPAALKRALIDKFGWEIDFSLSIARKSIARGDVVYAAGCCFRAAACLLQTLFALNEQYWLNEKGAVALAETFTRRPVDFRRRIESAFALLAENGPAIAAGIDLLAGLRDELAPLLEAEKEASVSRTRLDEAPRH